MDMAQHVTVAMRSVPALLTSKKWTSEPPEKYDIALCLPMYKV